jgi:hypothetical protein
MEDIKMSNKQKLSKLIIKWWASNWDIAKEEIKKDLVEGHEYAFVHKGQRYRYHNKGK